jgi:hypothetical protein
MWENNIKTDLRSDRIDTYEFIWLMIGAVEGDCEHGSLILISMRIRVILESIYNWWNLRKGSASEAHNIE